MLSFSTRVGKIIESWADYPLHPSLQVKHLRSYLERRFGKPLETDVSESEGVTFRAPRGSGTKAAVLLAIPLMRDPESGEIFSVFRRLSEVAQLVSGLDPKNGLDAPPIELNEPWIGPMFDSNHLRQATNDAAARAMRAWLTAAGLATEIEAIRDEHHEAPPAPGLEDLRKIAERAARGAAIAADLAWGLCQKVTKYSHDILASETPGTRIIKRLYEAEKQLFAAHKKTLGLAQEAERALRSLAQFGFGVSALLTGSSRVEQLGRACTAVLHPAEDQGIAAPLQEDGVTLLAESRGELMVEIAGILSRLLIDRETKVRFEAPGPGGCCFEFVVEEGDLLAGTYKASSTSSGPAEKRGRARGQKPRGSQNDLVQKWPSPVTVSQPAKIAVSSLFDASGIDRPSRITITVEPARSVPSALCYQTPEGLPQWVM